jgi:hypothetical protein
MRQKLVHIQQQTAIKRINLKLEIMHLDQLAQLYSQIVDPASITRIENSKYYQHGKQQIKTGNSRVITYKPLQEQDTLQ